MAESLGEAVLDLRAEKRGFDQDIDQAERKAVGLDQTFTRIGGNLAGFGDKMTLGVTLPIAAAGAAAFKLASDAQESSNKFEIVMGGAADRTRAALKELETSIPLTTGELLGLAAGAQDLLVPMGLARDAGADMSLQFVELAGDISAFNNVPVAQVLADIKSGLVGSSEPLFKYGVDTRVAALETVALTNGLIEEGEKLDDVARAQAVLLQIQAQSTDAMGAAAREADGAAQSTAFFMREVKQLGETIGTQLLPIVTPMIQKLTEAVKWFGDLDPATQKWVVRIGLLVAAIGPLLSITGRLFLIGGKIAGMMIANTAATTANTAATTANTAAVGASGLAKALGVATLALGAFWAGWKAGEFLADQLGIQENALANWLDEMEFFGPSIQEIRADTDEAAKSFGTYRTAAEIAADETARLAAETANKLTPAIVDAGAAAGDAVDPATKYADAIAALGIVSQEDLDQELANLALAIESGEVPAETMRPLLEEYRLKLEELGRISPEVGAKIDGLTQDINEQDAAIDGIVGKIPPATNAMDGLLGSMGQLPPVVTATGDTVEEALLKMAAAGETNAFALGDMIAQTHGLTAEQGLALTSYRGNTAEIATMAEKLRGEWGPAIQASTEKQLGLTEATKEGSAANVDFLGGLLSGIPILGELGKGFDFLGTKLKEGIGKINEFVEKGTGFLQEKLTGLFAEGSKLGSFLSDGLGQAVGIAIPFIGPLIAPFVGKLAGLVGKGIKKIGSFFSGIFGGVSGAEKEGRQVAGAFRDSMAAALTDTAALDQINATFSSAADKRHAKFLSSIGQDLIAMGHSAEQAGAMARSFGTQLFEAEKQGGAAVDAVIAKIQEASSTSIAATEAVATASTTAVEQAAAASTAAVEGTADATAAAVQQAATASTTAAAAAVVANEKAATDAVNGITVSTGQIAAVSVSAARATEDAWVTSASRTVQAWDAARRATVGASSIIDIQVLGSDAAKQLGDDQAAAAVKTEEEWKRVNRDLAMDAGGDAERLRRARDTGMDAGGRDGFRGGATGTLVVKGEFDGREVTRVVLKLTPEVRSKLGIR